MTLDELEAWIESAEYVTTAFSQYDESSNHEEERIFKKDGSFFKISFQNDHPYEVWNPNGGGWMRDVYPQPTPVKKITRRITVTEWVETST